MRYSFFVLLILLLACSDSTEKTEQASLVKTLHAIPQKVEVQYPSAWMHSFNPDSNSPSALITIQTPLENQQDAYQENVQFYHEVMPMRISDSLYHQSQIGQIKINNPGITIENRGKHVFGSHHFNEWYFQFDKNNVAYCVHGYTCLEDSVGFNFTYTSTKEKEKSYQTEVQNILSSFHPL